MDKKGLFMNSDPLSNLMKEGARKLLSHAWEKVKTMLEPVLSDMGMVATNPVAASTIKAKYRWGGSCLQAGNLPEVSAATVWLKSQLEELGVQLGHPGVCLWGWQLRCVARSAP